MDSLTIPDFQMEEICVPPPPSPKISSTTENQLIAISPLESETKLPMQGDNGREGESPSSFSMELPRLPSAYQSEQPNQPQELGSFNMDRIHHSGGTEGKNTSTSENHDTGSQPASGTSHSKIDGKTKLNVPKDFYDKSLSKEARLMRVLQVNFQDTETLKCYHKQAAKATKQNNETPGVNNPSKYYESSRRAEEARQPWVELANRNFVMNGRSYLNPYVGRIDHGSPTDFRFVLRQYRAEILAKLGVNMASLEEEEMATFKENCHPIVVEKVTSQLSTQKLDLPTRVWLANHFQEFKDLRDSEKANSQLVFDKLLYPSSEDSITLSKCFPLRFPDLSPTFPLRAILSDQMISEYFKAVRKTFYGWKSNFTRDCRSELHQGGMMGKLHKGELKILKKAIATPGKNPGWHLFANQLAREGNMNELINKLVAEGKISDKLSGEVEQTDRLVQRNKALGIAWRSLTAEEQERYEESAREKEEKGEPVEPERGTAQITGLRGAKRYANAVLDGLGIFGEFYGATVIDGTARSVYFPVGETFGGGMQSTEHAHAHQALRAAHLDILKKHKQLNESQVARGDVFNGPITTLGPGGDDEDFGPSYRLPPPEFTSKDRAGPSLRTALTKYFKTVLGCLFGDAGQRSDGKCSFNEVCRQQETRLQNLPRDANGVVVPLSTFATMSDVHLVVWRDHLINSTTGPKDYPSLNISPPNGIFPALSPLKMGKQLNEVSLIIKKPTKKKTVRTRNRAAGGKNKRKGKRVAKEVEEEEEAKETDNSNSEGEEFDLGNVTGSEDADTGADSSDIGKLTFSKGAKPQLNSSDLAPFSQYLQLKEMENGSLIEKWRNKGFNREKLQAQFTRELRAIEFMNDTVLKDLHERIQPPVESLQDAGSGKRFCYPSLFVVVSSLCVNSSALIHGVRDKELKLSTLQKTMSFSSLGEVENAYILGLLDLELEMPAYVPKEAYSQERFLLPGIPSSNIIRMKEMVSRWIQTVLQELRSSEALNSRSLPHDGLRAVVRGIAFMFSEPEPLSSQTNRTYFLVLQVLIHQAIYRYSRRVLLPLLATLVQRAPKGKSLLGGMIKQMHAMMKIWLPYFEKGFEDYEDTIEGDLFGVELDTDDADAVLETVREMPWMNASKNYPALLKTSGSRSVAKILSPCVTKSNWNLWTLEVRFIIICATLASGSLWINKGDLDESIPDTKSSIEQHTELYSRVQSFMSPDEEPVATKGKKRKQMDTDEYQPESTIPDGGQVKTKTRPRPKKKEVVTKPSQPTSPFKRAKLPDKDTSESTNTRVLRQSPTKSLRVRLRDEQERVQDEKRRK